MKMTIDASLGPGNGQVLFTSSEKVTDWVATERTFWNTLFQGVSTSVNSSRLYGLMRQQIDSTLDFITGRIEQANAALRQPGNRPFDVQSCSNEIASHIKTTYGAGKMIFSGSAKAKFLESVKQTQGADVAACAFAGLIGIFVHEVNSVAAKGLALATLHCYGVVDVTNHEEKAMEHLRDKWDSQLQEKAKQFDERLEEMARSTLEADQRRAKADSELNSQMGRGNKGFADIQQEWLRLKRVYDDEFALQKSVRYWLGKARGHVVWSIVWGSTSLVVVAAVFGLLYRIIEITLQVPAGAPTTWHPEYWRVGVLVAAGVFGVWVVRIFVRLFLSNMHLLTDARERVVMAKTFFSFLRHGRGLDEKERHLILQTLFRPTATGVVDDGPPLAWLDLATKQLKG